METLLHLLYAYGLWQLIWVLAVLAVMRGLELWIWRRD